MKKVITSGQDTLNKLNSGCSNLMQALAPNYGLPGKTVLNASYSGAPDVLGKGMAIAAAINFRDVTEDAGAALLRSAGEKTAAQTGDGCKTSMLIAQSVIRDGTRSIAAGCNPVFIRRGLELSADVAEKALYAASVSASAASTERIAELVSGDADLGLLVCEALTKVGRDGEVAVRASDNDKCYVQKDSAYSIPAGFQSKYMAESQTLGETVWENAAVFACTAPINSIYDILPLLDEACIQKRPLLILANHIAPDVVRSFVSNIAQGAIRLCSVEMPGVGAAKQSALEDVAALTGAIVFGTPLYPDVSAADLNCCGSAGKVRIMQDRTLLYDTPAGTTGLETHIEHLRALLKLPHNELEDERLRQRIAKLTGSTAELRIAAPTDAQRRYLTARAECALKAARSAANDGVLAGGGTAYIRAIPAVEKLCATLSGDSKVGAEILSNALKAPLRTIASNCGQAPAEVVANVVCKRGNWGFDAASGQYVDMMHNGIIEPTIVLTTALRAAVSVGAQILTAGAAVLTDGIPLSSLPVPDDLHITPQDFL